MAFYCNGKKGVCDKYPVCKHTCEHFDNSGGKHIDGLDSKHITTNADRIRAMSDEELAELFGRFGFCETNIIPNSHCRTQRVCSLACVKQWLKQPVEE